MDFELHIGCFSNRVKSNNAGGVDNMAITDSMLEDFEHYYCAIAKITVQHDVLKIGKQSCYVKGLNDKRMYSCFTTVCWHHTI